MSRKNGWFQTAAPVADLSQARQSYLEVQNRPNKNLLLSKYDLAGLRVVKTYGHHPQNEVKLRLLQGFYQKIDVFAA